jgi:acyl transferase domain-containing protein
VDADSALRDRCDVIIGRGGYLSNKMCEGYLRADLLEHLLTYLQMRFPSLGQAELDELAADMRATMPPNAGPDSSATGITNLVASRAANRLNLRGAAYLVDAACASSLLAVEHAVMRLRSGACDLAIAGGIALCHIPTFWCVFHQLGAISESSVARPFDRRADGLLIGEGAGAVALKRVADSLRDRDQIYAIIKGAGSASDGRATSLLTPSSDGQVRALENAYRDAQVSPDSIGYLEAHGTATKVGDPVELQTIKKFFGRSALPPRRAMGTVKSMIGHTMPAAGIASLIRTALALAHKILPPSLHCEEPHPALSDAPFYLNSQVRPWIHSPGGELRRAGVNAFGFGGINTHVILEEVSGRGKLAARRRPFCDVLRRPSELLVFAASSPADLIVELQRLATNLASRQRLPSLADISFTTLGEFDADQPCRLALIASDLEDLQRQIDRCCSRLADVAPCFAEAENIYYSSAADQPLGKVAAIFPGTGLSRLFGKYPEHLKMLCLHFPEMREVFDQAELRDRHPDDSMATSTIFWPPESLPEPMRNASQGRIAIPQVASNKAPEVHAARIGKSIALGALTVSHWASWRLVQELKIPVDMLCGQSMGELAALCAAGIMEIDEVLPPLWTALARIPEYHGDGRLGFAMASEDVLAPFLAETPDVSIAMHIAPKMLVLGGPQDQVQAVSNGLRKQGIMASELPYPPAHTRAQGYLRDALAEVWNGRYEFHTARLPVYSAITEEAFPDGEQRVRATALLNLDRPVRYWQTLRTMYHQGARVYLHLGNGTIDSTLKAMVPDSKAVAAEIDVDHRDAITQLHHVCAKLLSSGIRFDPAAIHRYRNVQVVDFDAVDERASESPFATPLRLDLYPFGPEVLEAAMARLQAPPQAETESLQPGGDMALREDEEPELPENAALRSAEVSLREAVRVESHPQPALEEYQRPEADDEIRLPFLGQIAHLVPGQEIVNQRVLDLDTDLYLQDHVFINATEYKRMEECLPLLPMAMMVEAMAETAACLAPGLGLVGLERMKALRWVALRDERRWPIEIRARMASVDHQTGVVAVYAELHSEGNLNASATFHFGSEYRQEIQFAFQPLENPRPWSWTIQELYGDRHAFNGPRLQSVTDLHRVGGPGGTGSLTVLPDNDLFARQPRPELLLDPVILDGIAQFLGLWAREQQKYALPNGIRKLELYRPAPPAGTKVPIRVDFTRAAESGRMLVSNVEVQDGSGNVWMRIEGFTQWVFEWTLSAINAMRLPARYCVSEPMQSCALPNDVILTVLPKENIPGGSFDWAGRLCLTHAEGEMFHALESPRRKWEWLRGRLAAKDAVRLWMTQTHGIEMVHPLAISILADEYGRPVASLDGDFPPPPHISIAHMEDRSCAAASSSPVGIDVQSIEQLGDDATDPGIREVELDFVRNVTNHESRGMLNARVRCAKQAVGKALGIAPHASASDLELIDADTPDVLLVQQLSAGHRLVARVIAEDCTMVACAQVSHAMSSVSHQLGQSLSDASM